MTKDPNDWASYCVLPSPFSCKGPHDYPTDLHKPHFSKKWDCLVLKTEYIQVGTQKVNYWYSWYYCAILNSQDVTDILQITDQQLDCKA